MNEFRKNDNESGVGKTNAETDEVPRKNTVLIVEGLKKRYGKAGKYAVEDVSFTVEAGEIVGLVGTNGAGKSTTIKSVTGFLPFDEGRIAIDGFDIVKEPVQAKRSFGYVSDDRAAFDKMTGMEYLSFVADVRGVGKEERAERVREFQERFRLGDKIYNLIASYSHGMRQKICLMASLIHQPKLWILDEPMTGLDPQTMKGLKDAMLEYGRKGNGVLFSSHNLDAVEQLSDRVVMIKDGRKIRDSNLKNFREENFGKSFEEVFLELYGEEE